jgi:prevent-host-death family protein
MPDEYSLYDAKAKLSALVRQVREGRTIVITVHGEPAAELRPIDRTTRKQTIADRVAELEGRGELSPATRTPGTPVAPAPVNRRRGALKRFLEERE